MVIYKKSSEMPLDMLCNRLKKLSEAVVNKSFNIPARVHRDADLVLSEAGIRLRSQGEKITELESKLIELEFTSGIDRVQDSNELPMVKNH